MNAIALLDRKVREARRRIGAALRPTPPQPSPLAPFDAYFKHAGATRLRTPHLFLSFDCDTDRDFAVVGELMRFLGSIGVRATFAIPGVQLEKGAQAYAPLTDLGAEFMNHGYAPHAAWSEADDRYVSITWYHEMSAEAVEADMRRGDETVRRITGQAPSGFRAPHFGCFKEPGQLSLLRRVARDLGYSYCSTTVPEVGLREGPIHRAEGLIEVPTFGSFRYPQTLLDSWTYLSDRRDYTLSEDYADLMIETVDQFVAARAPVLFSWYGDPSHVVGQAPFERAMRHLAGKGVPSLLGREAVALAA